MIAAWLRRLQYVVRQRQADADVRAELEFHREMKTRELEATGLSAVDASITARRAMGNTLIAREEARAVWIWSSIDNTLRDIRHGVRILRNSPTFAVTSIVTLGLCIGANAAIYTLVDWLLIRPLQFPDVDRLAWVETYAEQNGRVARMESQNGRAFLALAEHATAVVVGAMGGTLTVNMVNGDHAIAVEQQRLSASMFTVLGVRPFLGRGFTQDEDRDGGPTAVVLSYQTWMQTFGGDARVVGSRVLLRGEPYTVVGVMPRKFRTNAPVDVWTPLRASIIGEGGGNNYTVLARLRQDVTWPVASGDVEAVGQDLFTRIIPAPGVTRRFMLVPVQQAMNSAVRPPLFILWGAVTVVLLIGCVNLAGLQLARAVKRTPEIATRMAVGGGRVAIVSQLLAESLVIAAGGCLVGLAFGEAILRVFAKEIALFFPDPIRLDARVLALTAGVSLLTTFVFGLIPALKASRVDVRAMFVQGATINAESRRVRQLIVGTELALTVVLLVGAGLFVRTFEHFESLQAGFDGRGIVAATASLQDVRYETSSSLNLLFDRTLTRIRQLPGIQSASVGLTMPYQRALNNPWRRADNAPGEVEIINLTYVTPDYFRTLGMPIVLGRGFAQTDSADSPHVAVVNQAFVRRYRFGDAILGFDLDPTEHLQVIGVVGDVPQTNGGLRGFEPLDSIPGWYIPAAQVSDRFIRTAHTWFSPSWVVRTSRPVAGVAAEMQRALKDVDPLLPFNTFRTIDDLRGEALRLPRAAAMLFATLAGLAVLLSSIGLYGIVATSIGDRVRELGLRIALGSSPRRTFIAASWPGVLVSAAGIGAGIVLARASAVLVRSLIWGVQPTDPLTFAGAALLGLAVAAVAVVIPTIRVLSLNPVDALRHS
jgi:predicted permease